MKILNLKYAVFLHNEMEPLVQIQLCHKINIHLNFDKYVLQHRVFLKTLHGIVISFRKNKYQVVTSLVSKYLELNIYIRIQAQITQKNGIRQKVGQKAFFVNNFFFTISKTHFDPTCKKSGSYMSIITVEI